MAAALALAERGVGQTGTNPSVGCIIVRDSIIVGRGWTQNGGRPHAEAMALAQAGADIVAVGRTAPDEAVLKRLRAVVGVGGGVFAGLQGFGGEAVGEGQLARKSSEPSGGDAEL